MTPFQTEFQFEVLRDELVTHLKSRAQAHRARATELEGKASAIRDSGTLSEEDMQVLERSPLSKTGPYGPASMVGMAGMGGMGGQHHSQVIQAVIQVFASRAKDNRHRAAELDFYAGHVPAGKASFLITRPELRAFEFLGTSEWTTYVPVFPQQDPLADNGLEGLG